MMKLKLIWRSKHIADSLSSSYFGLEPQPPTPAVKLFAGNDHSKDQAKEKKTFPKNRNMPFRGAAEENPCET